VWAGDFGATAMNQVTGSAGAGPLFNGVARLMAERLGRMPSLQEPPPGARTVVVCAESGLPPNDLCPRKLSVASVGETKKTRCAMHCAARIDARTGLPADQSTPPAFVVERLAYDLPPEFAGWLADSVKLAAPTPTASREPWRSGLVITRPRTGDVYIIEPGYSLRNQSIELAANLRGVDASVEWFVVGSLVARAPWPYTASWRLAAGAHVAVARSGRLASPPVRFEVR